MFTTVRFYPSNIDWNMICEHASSAYGPVGIRYVCIRMHEHIDFYFKSPADATAFVLTWAGHVIVLDQYSDQLLVQAVLSRFHDEFIDQNTTIKL